MEVVEDGNANPVEGVVDAVEVEVGAKLKPVAEIEKWWR